MHVVSLVDLTVLLLIVTQAWSFALLVGEGGCLCWDGALRLTLHLSRQYVVRAFADGGFLRILLVALVTHLELLQILEDRHVAGNLCLIHLVLLEDAPVHFMNILCVEHHLLRVEVDGAIVDAELVLSEERYGNFLEVQIDNLGHDLRAANLLVVRLDALRQVRDSVDF